MSQFDPLAVIAFWRAAGPSRWFRADQGFDALVRLRLGAAHDLAATGMLDDWIADPAEALALILVLDQAPRNMFRRTPRAFATDAHARRITELMLARGWDERVPRAMRSFVYLPLEHSEDMGDQELCCRLFKRMGDREGLKWAKLHRDIIREFGRFPHRNAILGRKSTKAELKFLAEGGFSG